MEVQLARGESIIARDAARRISADFLERLSQRSIEAWESDPDHFDG
jgi:hypothetical protein